MNHSPPPGGFDYDTLVNWALLIALSLWGGWASFVRKMREGHARAWNITELVGELVIAGFTGIVTAHLCDAIPSFPVSLKYAFVGISAHMGSRALFKFEAMMNSRLNLPTDVQKKDDDHAA